MMNRQSPLPFLAIFLLALCIAVSPATAATTWLPPTDAAIYGVQWDSSLPSPALTWIDANGNVISNSPDFDNHVIWGNIKRVLLSDDNVVTRDFNPRGENLDLSGASGKVMTEIPKFYVKSTKEEEIYRWWISPDFQTGYVVHPAFLMRGGEAIQDYIYVGSYEATLKVDETGGLVLDSRTGEQPWTGYNNNPRDAIFAIGYKEGSTQPTAGMVVADTSGTEAHLVDFSLLSGSWSGGDAEGILYLSQSDGSFTADENLFFNNKKFAVANTTRANAGLKATINDFEGWGNNLGTGYGAMNIWTHSAIHMLYTVEHATWASQETTGLGIVSKGSGSGFAGEVTGYDGIDDKLDVYGSWGDTSAGYSAVCYRTMENLWGNTWTWITGYTSTDTEYRITNRDGTGSLTTHPLASGYETSEATPLQGVSNYVSGYWTSLEHEDLLQFLFIPDNVTGGSDKTYGTDYFYSHNPGSSRVLRAGGYWTYARTAGLGCLASYDDASYSSRNGGARLEFVGPTTMAGGAPGAQYTLSAQHGAAPLTVTFTDTSSGAPGAWFWDFGDGVTSTEQNPEHTYDSAGDYIVNLSVINPYGADTIVSSVPVSVYNQTHSAFEVDVQQGEVPIEVTFTDRSSGDVTIWNWNFGDGKTSTEQNPIHIYEETGIYTVILIVSNKYSGSGDTSSTQVAIYNKPHSAFMADVKQGEVPIEVTFTDRSSGDVTDWLWNFGDGSTSIEQNPKHVYETPGSYTVTLTVSNTHNGCSHTTTSERFITVYSSLGYVAIPILDLVITLIQVFLVSVAAVIVIRYLRDAGMIPGFGRNGPGGY